MERPGPRDSQWQSQRRQGAIGGFPNSPGGHWQQGLRHPQVRGKEKGFAVYIY